MMQVQDVELSGSDYFLFAMDRIMRSAGCSDSQCRMVVKLNGRIGPDDFRNKVNQSHLLQWMVNVRKNKKIPFTLPRWRSNGFGNSLPVNIDPGEWNCFGENGSMLHYSRIGDKYHSRPALSFTLNQSEANQTTCVLNWDHTLMDAHGAEILVKHLAQFPDQKNLEQMLPVNGQVMDSRIDPLAGFGKRLSYARKSVHYISEASEMPIATLKHSSKKNKPTDQYCLIRFTDTESERIKTRCETLGLSYYHSLFYLAATIRALHAVRMQRGEDPMPYLVPVPLNLRKKGGGGPAFSNNVSFLFYRITPDEVEDFSKTVQVLKNQMREQLVQEIPYSYLEMMKILRRLPLSWYSKLLSGPTKGQFASFFFSFTGDSCPDMDSFLGKPVEEVVHLAPATSIPGFSVVFMRHRNSLKTILSLRDSLLANDELELFEQRLRSDLLAGDA